MIALMNLTGLV